MYIYIYTKQEVHNKPKKEQQWGLQATGPTGPSQQRTNLSHGRAAPRSMMTTKGSEVSDWAPGSPREPKVPATTLLMWAVDSRIPI